MNLYMSRANKLNRLINTYRITSLLGIALLPLVIVAGFIAPLTSLLLVPITFANLLILIQAENEIKRLRVILRIRNN